MYLCTYVLCVCVKAHARQSHLQTSRTDLQPKKLLCKYLTWILCGFWSSLRHTSTGRRTANRQGTSFVTLKYYMFCHTHHASQQQTRAVFMVWRDENGWWRGRSSDLLLDNTLTDWSALWLQLVHKVEERMWWYVATEKLKKRRRWIKLNCLRVYEREKQHIDILSTVLALQPFTHLT